MLDIERSALDISFFLGDGISNVRHPMSNVQLLDNAKDHTMIIKVLGSGCINCKTLERRTLEVLSEINLKAEVKKVEDLDSIVGYGIMRTPGLVIDEKVVWQGGVPTKEKIKELLESVPAGRAAS
jgi:small redox-active disulfide protein 2